MNLYDTLFSNAWTEQGGGGDTPSVLYDGDILMEDLYGTIGSDNYSLSENLSSLPETVTVVWDGVTYADLTKDEYNYYGASYDGEAFDFTNYPFAFAMFDTGGGFIDTFAFWGTEEGTFSATVSAIVGGGGEIMLTSLYATENGDYYADEGTAYNVVNVAVPIQEIVSIILTNHIGTTALFYGYYDNDGRIAQTSSVVSKNETRDFAYLKGDPCIPLYIKGINDATLPVGITVSATNSVTGQVVYSDDGKMAFIILSKLNGDTELDITV